MSRKRYNVTPPEGVGIDFEDWKEDRCPWCQKQGMLSEPGSAVMDGDELYVVPGGTDFLPHRNWECTNCGCKFRIVYAPFTAIVTEPGEGEDQR